MKYIFFLKITLLFDFSFIVQNSSQQLQQLQFFNQSLSYLSTENFLSTMSEVQYITYSLKPIKVDFFYIKPLYKQQQQVELPEYEGKNATKRPLSMNSFGSVQASSSNSILNKPFTNTPSDITSFESSSLQFQKIKRKYLDDYLFICNLGKGAYGRIQKLKNKLSGSIYAGKILLKSYNASTNKYKNTKLQQQIRIYSQICHPNIPELHQIYSWRNQYTLIMQFAKGQNLHSVMQNHPNQQQTIAKIIFQILDGLEYLHSLNIVHHDLKPENIMYDPESGVVKIVDFGESIQLQRQSQFISNQGGTYAYFAPQYFQDICSVKIDIWALGIIIYYLLEGKLYFNDSSKPVIKNKILTQQVRFETLGWTNRSQQCKDLILKMLQKDPQKRITAQQAKNHPWISQNCQNWSNPSKNILKNSIRSRTTASTLGKRCASYDKQINFKDNKQRKISCDISNNNQKNLLNTKRSRFHNK